MQEKDAASIPLHEQMMARYKGRMITDSRSPTGNWLGVTLEHAERGAVRLSLLVKQDMTNPYGNIHGGMMSALIDETIGWSVVSLEAAQHYTSLNLVVDFLYAAAAGDRITAAATVIREGKKIIYAECSVYNASDILLAKASSNLIATSMRINAVPPTASVSSEENGK